MDLQDEVDSRLDQGGIQSSEHLVGIDLQDIRHIVHLQDSLGHQDLNIDHVQVRCIQGHHQDILGPRIQAGGPLLHNCIQVHSLDQVGHQLREVQILEDPPDLEA